MTKKTGGHRLNRLTPTDIERGLSAPGMYADGGGLYLQVAPTGARSWIYRYMLKGRERAMGLGPLHAVTLDQARQKATAARGLRRRGIDPLDAREAAHTEAPPAPPPAAPPGEAVDAVRLSGYYFYW